MNKNYVNYVDQLEGSYKEYFTQIENMLKEYTLAPDEHDEAISELLDLVLCAQRDNKSCEDIFGTNIKAFCKDYVNALYPYVQVFNIFSFIIISSLSMLFLSIAYVTVHKLTGSIHNIIDGKVNAMLLIGIIVGILSAEINNFYHKSKVSRKSAQRNKKLSIINLVLICIVSGIISLIVELQNIALMVSLRDIWPVLVTIMLLGFSGCVVLKVLEGRGENTLDEKIIKAINKNYNKKRTKKGWSEQRFILWHRRFYAFWFPVIVIEFILLMILSLIAISLTFLHHGTTGILIITIVLLVYGFFLTAIISALIDNKKIARKLLEGSIKLNSDMI